MSKVSSIDMLECLKSNPEIVVRFWSKADVKGEGDCWEWKAGKLTTGYGQFWLQKSVSGAHRVAWMISKAQPLPEGLVVMHSCDNRACVNPIHLVLGTYADNTQDMIKKGRALKARGVKHRSAKLTEKKVRDIRERHATGGISQRQLAQEFGVAPPSISYIVHRKKWAHVI